MSKFRICVLLCFITCFFCSCHQADKKLALKSQRLIDDADLYLDHHDYPSALEKAQGAQRNLGILIEKYPTNADYILLFARINLTLFLIDNAELIRNAAMDPESLVRIPNFDMYVSYNTYLSPVLNKLPSLINQNPKLTTLQEASLHTLLASIYRLNKSTLPQAEAEYEKAIQTNRTWLLELEEEKKPGKSNVFSIIQVKNQIRSLRTALVEVCLLDKDWNRSLLLLKQIMAGSDLEYFSIHFSLLNKEIQELNRKIASQNLNGEDNSKHTQFFKFFNKRKPQQDSPLAELAAKSTDEIARIQAEINLAETQNNLIYRMICYYNLNDMQNFNEAHTVLKEAYPEIDRQVVDMLKRTKKAE